MEAFSSDTWGKLRQRKVVQWTTVYVAFAWGILQGIGFVADAFALPTAAKQLATIGLAVGLPITMLFAWFHGDQGKQSVTPVEVVLVTLLLAAGGAVFALYRSEPPPPVTPSKPASAVRRPTIAVLPFTAHSRGPDDSFFAIGIQDDIQTQLTRIGSVEVVAQTSVEQLRDARLPTQELAQRLKASALLRGSVQRAGDRVRVSVQLIDPRTETQLWADSYDRELTTENIFRIQSEISASVVRALNIELPNELASDAAEMPTESVDAWVAYQKGRQVLSHTEGNPTVAEAHYRDAIGHDPNFALAHVGLGFALATQAKGITQNLAEPKLVAAEASASEALKLVPDLAEAWSLRGYIALSRKQYAQAETYTRRALALNDKSALAHRNYSTLLLAQGDVSGALAEAEAALGLTPIKDLAYVFEAQNRYDAAASLYRASLQRSRTLLGEGHPEVPVGMTNLAFALRELGQAEEAMALLTDAYLLRKKYSPNDPHTAAIATSLAFWLVSAGRASEAVAYVDDALMRRANMFGTDSVPFASTETVKAHALLALSRPEEALAVAGHARRTLSRLEPDTWRIAAAKSVEGAALMELGRFAHSEELLLDSQRTIHTAPIKELADWNRRYLADLYRKIGHPELALKYGAAVTNPVRSKIPQS